MCNLRFKQGGPTKCWRENSNCETGPPIVVRMQTQVSFLTTFTLVFLRATTWSTNTFDDSTANFVSLRQSSHKVVSSFRLITTLGTMLKSHLHFDIGHFNRMYSTGGSSGEFAQVTDMNQCILFVFTFIDTCVLKWRCRHLLLRALRPRLAHAKKRKRRRRVVVGCVSCLRFALLGPLRCVFCGGVIGGRKRKAAAALVSEWYGTICFQVWWSWRLVVLPGHNEGHRKFQICLADRKLQPGRTSVRSCFTFNMQDKITLILVTVPCVQVLYL